MKKISMLIAAIAIFATSFASSGYMISLTRKATEIYLPINKTMQISLKDLSEIKVKDYEKISGKHLNFFETLSFKVGQKKLRNSIAPDGTITNKRLLKAMSPDDYSVGFHPGGFALGFFFGIIGVLIAYLIKTNKGVDRNRIKWAWIGFGLSLFLFFLFIALIIALIPRIY